MIEIIAMIECVCLFFFQSGQRFDTNSANEGSTNKLETNGFAGAQQQVNAQQVYTNNPGQLNLITKKSLLRFLLLRTNLSLRIRIESVHVDGRTTVLEQSISINDDTNKKSDHVDNDNDDDDDDNHTEKDLYKTASNLDHTNNTAFEPVQKTASTSNVFSRLMHSEEHVQNNNNKKQQPPILKKAADAAFNEFVSLLLQLKDLSFVLFSNLFGLRNASLSLSLSL